MLQTIVKEEIENCIDQNLDVNKYNLLRVLARITHANICIKGGNYLQYEIYKAILDSSRHLEVHHEYKIKLIDIEVLIDSKKKRKHHKVDILIIDDTSVIAINSKGRSFNNTESEDLKLDEYLWYKKSIEAAFPGKSVTYIILKDEYDPTDSSLNVYHYLNANGIPVYNSEEFLSEYNTNFQELNERRQVRCVAECERVLIAENINIEKLYEAFY